MLSKSEHGFSAFPNFVDPSHGAGADGLMIEVHINPEQTLSEGIQSLNLTQFDNLMKLLKKIMSFMKNDGEVISA